MDVLEPAQGEGSETCTSVIFTLKEGTSWLITITFRRNSERDGVWAIECCSAGRNSLFVTATSRNKNGAGNSFVRHAITTVGRQNKKGDVYLSRTGGLGTLCYKR